MFFDSHAHINSGELTVEERTELIEAIERSSLDYVMDIGFDVPSSVLAAKHASEIDWCYAAVGCHPHDSKTMNDEQLETIRQLAMNEKVKAIGEIGLDFHYDLSDRDIQREWFRRQIRLANELKMPIAIHSREADQETMDILIEEGAFSEERKSWFLKRPASGSQTAAGHDAASGSTTAAAGQSACGSSGHSACGSSGHSACGSSCQSAGGSSGQSACGSSCQSACGSSGQSACGASCNDYSTAESTPDAMVSDARVLIHCFSSSAEMAKQYVKLGATLGICGPVTYKNNRKTVAVVETIPIEYLLIETDSPFLAPVPMRGKRNVPMNVEYTADKIAEIKGLTLAEVAEITKANAMRFYGIK